MLTFPGQLSKKEKYDDWSNLTLWLYNFFMTASASQTLLISSKVIAFGTK